MPRHQRLVYLGLSETDVLGIWTDIKNGRGNHGDFLKSFAEAYIRADYENVRLLEEASVVLIEKYHLNIYARSLWTFRE